jgi:hypothetical protein
MRNTYIKDCIKSNSVLDIDDYIDRWHEGECSNLHLHEYLGFDSIEYNQFILFPNTLPLLVSLAVRRLTSKEILELSSDLIIKEIMNEDKQRKRIS